MLLLTLALVGFVIWMITQIPMPPLFRTGIYVIAAVCVIVYLMRVLGIVDIPLPHVR
jgi:hypothetical protein